VYVRGTPEMVKSASPDRNLVRPAQAQIHPSWARMIAAAAQQFNGLHDRLTFSLVACSQKALTSAVPNRVIFAGVNEVAVIEYLKDVKILRHHAPKLSRASSSDCPCSHNLLLARVCTVGPLYPHCESYNGCFQKVFAFMMISKTHQNHKSALLAGMHKRWPILLPKCTDTAAKFD
jgi:hypothetical protein